MSLAIPPEEKGIDHAQRIAEEEELGLRRPQNWGRWLIPIIAISWTLFQLSLASWLLLDSTIVRAIHLAFAFAIVFLGYPTFRRSVNIPGLRWLGARRRVTWQDALLAIIAILSALYIVFDYEGLAVRVGRPLPRDIIVGLTLIVMLIEAARRVIGPALPIIVIVFTIYALFGPYMPDILAFKGVSINRYTSQIALTTEGIYGIPLHVSATIVFLFVLFGALLDKAGGGRFFIDLAMSLLGRYKGGPAKAAVLSSGLSGLVSGSSIANVVTTGTFTIPLMKKVGYPANKAAAIEVAASTNGQLMPPIMGAAAFIIAEYVNLPYLEVCKAAAIPAFASYATLFFITHIEASKLGLKGLPKEELPRFITTLMGGLHYLVPLGVLLYELIIPRHSPDMAAFRAILTLLPIMLLQHAARARRDNGDVKAALLRGVRDVFDGLVSGARNMVAVAIATAAAGIVVGVVTMGLGGRITDIIDILSGGNIIPMLGITAVASLILGMGLPTTANYIVMASLTAPVIVTIAAAQDFAVPLIAAHLFCFYFGILADDTPPVGLAAYAASAIAHSDPIPTGVQGFMYDIRTAVLPFIFIFNTDLLLWGINDPFLALLIFIMTCLACFSFAAATQGWFIARARWYEIVLLLGVTAVLFRPGFVSSLVGLPGKYPAYGIGLALLALVTALQWPRRPKETAVAEGEMT
jgi:TRAP transporter 4TM/12TM fusion protein